jgi:hypothetical protein
LGSQLAKLARWLGASGLFSFSGCSRREAAALPITINANVFHELADGSGG